MIPTSIPSITPTSVPFPEPTSIPSEVPTISPTKRETCEESEIKCPKNYQRVKFMKTIPCNSIECTINDCCRNLNFKI